MKYICLSDLAKRTGFRRTQLQHWLSERNKNGLAKGIRIVRGRSYFDPVFFNRWVEANKKSPATTKKPKLPKEIDVAEPMIPAPERKTFFSIIKDIMGY